jgi:hypothetical protein
VDTGVHKNGLVLMIINHLTYSGIVDKSKIEKITLSLNPFQLLFGNIYSSHSQDLMKTTFFVEPKTRIKLTFSSFSVRKLNSIHNKCISEKELNNFNEDDFGFIVKDCYFKSLNESYGCIPFVFINNLFVYFDRHILKYGYKVCKKSKETIDNRKKMKAKCFKESIRKCNTINFNSKIETTKLLSNETILEFIPQKNPRIAYTETYKTDFNGFIYNCGGVLSLWFGLTPIKLVDILKYLPLISKILISKSIKFVHYLKAISIRFAQNLISICKRFGLYLFGIIIRIAENSFGICKRFALSSIAKIISFAYNLIEIFMQFAKNSFGICK